jgi:ATP-dependent RNA/DNA helicase IGHMBP2
MDYFKQLQQLLEIEQAADRLAYAAVTQQSSAAERRQNGLCWYPVAIKGSEMGLGDYLTVEAERTTHQELEHQLRFGMPVALFSNHNAKTDRLEGIISYLNGNTVKISFRTDELPDWSSDGKLGIDLLFDDNSYTEMFKALQQAELKRETKLLQVITGEQSATFAPIQSLPFIPGINDTQKAAIEKIIAANELVVVHGPPGTGKTTTIVQAIKHLLQIDKQQILVVAPSNTAVDLLTEKLTEQGISVLRVGNPARVSEQLMQLTLDGKIAAHPSNKEIRQLKKQANEYRNLAQKYKRNFGASEREQRKALFTEARQIMKEVLRLELYIINDLLNKAQVITATLVGSNHHTVKSLTYHTVFIDEAAQALEPACYIPILKAKKLVLAGDHQQLPPTIKSMEAARAGLGISLMEKSVALHPAAVSLLQTQYRMHETIMGFPSAEFYKNQLQAAASVAHHRLFDDDLPLVFIDTAGCGFEEQSLGTSTYNMEEAGFLLKHFGLLVDVLLQKYPAADFPTVGIISPYRQQVLTLKERLANHGNWVHLLPKIAVNTIDSFQGQERDIIYISLTRSNAAADIGFLADTRRLNVAMTRARKKLVVIGDSATLSKNGFYGRFIEYAQANNSYFSAWEFVNE